MKLSVHGVTAGPWKEGDFTLKPQSFELETPGRLALIGPNGSGKSTLLRRLAGLLPGEGQVMLDDRNLMTLGSRERARYIGLLSQNEYTPEGMTALEYVSLGRFPIRSMLELGDTEDGRYARESMKRCGVEHLADRSLGHLSGGERQLVRVAAALVQRTRILLLDEPASFLDPGRGVRLHTLLDELLREQELLLIWVSHDLNEVLGRDCQVLALNAGERQWMGASGELPAQDWLSTMYGCEWQHLVVKGRSWLLPGPKA